MCKNYSLGVIMAITCSITEESTIKEAIAAAHAKGSVFEHFPLKFRSNREVALAAVKRTGGMLQFVEGELNGDFELVLEALKKSAKAFIYASDTLKKDPLFIEKALVIKPEVKSYVDAYKQQTIKAESVVETISQTQVNVKPRLVTIKQEFPDVSIHSILPGAQASNPIDLTDVELDLEIQKAQSYLESLRLEQAKRKAPLPTILGNNPFGLFGNNSSPVAQNPQPMSIDRSKHGVDSPFKMTPNG